MKRLFFAVVVLAGSCASAPPLVSSSAVTLVEGAISVESPHFAAGEVTLQIGNAGEFSHTLVVTDDGGSVLAATGLIGPGEAATLTLDLVPGTYQFSCRIVASADGRVFDHYQMGMVARVVAVSEAEAAG
jgi:hypothetical protein